MFHDWGVSVFDPDNCRLYHQIQSTDVIPGTQEYVCGDRGTNCSWGAAINVADRYVYVTQPTKDRVLIISRIQMVVVDVSLCAFHFFFVVVVKRNGKKTRKLQGVFIDFLDKPL